MRPVEPNEDCARYAQLTDQRAVGERLSPDDHLWAAMHGSSCALCQAESAFYEALPGMLRNHPIARSHSRPPARRALLSARGKRNRWPAWVLLAAALTLGSFAAAKLVVRAGSRASAVPTVTDRGLSVPPATHEEAAPPALSAAARADDKPPKPTRGTPETSVEDLLRKARAERGAGHPAEAASLYRQLLRDFPRAPEARAARVSLGDLAFSQLADPAGALAAYDSYLQGGPGPLTLEARFGRIRALGTLGRKRDEEREIARFVQDYPGSSQAAMLTARRPAAQ